MPGCVILAPIGDRPPLIQAPDVNVPVATPRHFRMFLAVGSTGRALIRSADVTNGELSASFDVCLLAVEHNCSVWPKRNASVPTIAVICDLFRRPHLSSSSWEGDCRF